MSMPVAAQRDLLRLLTCGSVDDGKSTLIGRLLFECGAVADDALAALRTDSGRFGTTGRALDFALLVDGLEAEREQGITIDVAYRYFSSERRSFIIADTPGHELYTRNMATGASNSDLAVILVDARKGLATQTQRHSFICSLLGIRHVVLAINKIDLVETPREAFERIVADYEAFAAPLHFESVQPIPISARFGDNIRMPSPKTPWYGGPTLLTYLETVRPGGDGADQPFRFPVQWVSRADPSFRGAAGTVASGTVRTGDSILVAASNQLGQVDRILTADGDLTEAKAGDAVILTFRNQMDVGRGEVLSKPDSAPTVTDQFAAHLIWMSEDALLPGREYAMRIGHDWTVVSVTQIRHKIDVDTGGEAAARVLTFNEIGFCNLSSIRRVALDPYVNHRATGAFILVDRNTNRTCAAGMVAFSLQRAGDIRRETFLVDKEARAQRNGQTPFVLWLTGLSGSGKSTIAKIVEKRLAELGRRTYTLDGDNLRGGLNRDLGFTDADRVENIRRAGQVAKLFVDAGLIVICSFISPFRAERDLVREMLDPGEFIEVFVDTPLEICIERDPKGLYRRARAGLIRNFTGLGSPYERPVAPDLTINTEGQTPEQTAQVVLDWLLVNVPDGTPLSRGLSQ